MTFKTFFLLTCAVNLSCSFTVEFYSSQNYSGLLKKVILNKIAEQDCIQFDQTYEVRSLKTEKCVMVYETEYCRRINTKLPEGSKLYSIRVERDTSRFDVDGAYSNRKEERGVQSFHLCDTEPGAGLLNVDIYSGPSYTGDLVSSYGGVCECKNIPSYIVLKDNPFSIDNHEKNMYFYDKEDCTGQERFIPAGDSEGSRSVFRLDDNRAVLIKSFRPADSLICPKLDATIYKFTFNYNAEFGNLVRENITYTVTNKEHTTVTEKLFSNVTYTVEYTVAKAFTYIHSTRVKAGFEMDPQHVITSNSRDNLASSLEAHYQYPDTNQNAPTIATQSYNGLINRIKKPPCTKCAVTVTTLTGQGVPISYTAEATVTGMAGDNKVSAEQIRSSLPPEMKYVRKNDDYSVVVTVEGEVEGRMCVPLDVNLFCQPLPDC